MRQILNKFTSSPYIHHFSFKFPLNSSTLHKNISKFNQVSNKSPALFVSFNGVLQSPDVATTIRQALKQTSQKKNVPIHSFLQDNINGLTYYTATATKNIYANPFCLMGDLTAPSKSYTNIHKLLKFLGVNYQRIGKQTKIWNSFTALSQKQKQFTSQWLKVAQQKLKSSICKQRSIQKSVLQQFGKKLIHPKKALQLKLIDKITTIEEYKQLHFPNNKIKQINFRNETRRNGLNSNQLKVLAQLSQWIQQPKMILMAMQDPMNQLTNNLIEIIKLRMEDVQKLQELDIIVGKLVQKIQTNLENSHKLII